MSINTIDPTVTVLSLEVDILDNRQAVRESTVNRWDGKRRGSLPCGDTDDGLNYGKGLRPVTTMAGKSRMDRARREGRIISNRPT
jgi:hypothetical protein